MRFWLTVMGVTLAIALAAVVLALLFSWAWYTWGFFAAFAVLAGIGLVIGLITDRRHKRL
jgi:bacteriorhodopsin